MLPAGEEVKNNTLPWRRGCETKSFFKGDLGVTRMPSVTRLFDPPNDSLFMLDAALLLTSLQSLQNNRITENIRRSVCASCNVNCDYGLVYKNKK